ncbi:DNA-binding transcriptional activator of the SARP family [Streptomyces lincolnensis]|uniref:DNA-binding transcriptional activator of the SARP family n=1 Tax=Streptomyces lincolnensis TaxID=1915 RepID=A0A1B1MPT8_STRLN|nr:DNA-binding transcriptional activator of the SARP family [Streptomyces lincolnensis]
MDFRLLGPLDVQSTGRSLRLGGRRSRALLAVLLLHHGRTVPIDTITGAIWPGEPPNSALANIRTYVHELRRQLHRLDDGAQRLTSHPGGYRILVRPGELDVLNFRALVGAGERAVRNADHDGAAECFGRALRMWRGSPAEGLDVGQALTAKLTVLEEERWSAASALVDAQLALGRHEQVIPRLREILAERPLCERTWGRLMMALSGAGRAAEALEVYQQARRRLLEELAVEPGGELRSVHSAILNGSAGPLPLYAPAPGAAPARAMAPAPCDLPTRPPDFVGREYLLGELRRIAASQSDAVAERANATVVSVFGPAGVGKTATVVNAAYQMRPLFPDGQLFVSFGSATGAPRATGEVMLELLAALGLPQSAIPVDEHQQTAVYRAMVAERAMLIVLDDVADAVQIRPFLPGAGRSMALITSRPPLVELDVHERFALPPLSGTESLQLLAALAGRGQVDAEPEEAVRVVEACDRLPLALRIVGARLTAGTTASLSAMAHRLADHSRRLDELVVGDLSVRTRLTESYRALDPVARSAFERLASSGTSRVSSSTLRTELGIPERTADRVLEELVHHHFLVPAETRGLGRVHRIPELLRAYGRALRRRETAVVPVREAADTVLLV